MSVRYAVRSAQAMTAHRARRTWSFARERNGRPRLFPLQLQHAPAALRLDPDGELLHGLRQLLHAHVEPGEVVLGVVVRAPLTGVPVHDELPTARCGQRPQGVLAGGYGPPRHYEVGAGLEDGGLVRAGAPHLVPGNHVSEDRAAAGRGPAVAHREHRTRDARLD